MSTVEHAAEWVYRGLWRVLADWFRVPRHAPSLPVGPGQPLERFKPAQGFLRYLKLWFWLGLVGFDLVVTVIWLASFLISVWLGIALAPIWFVVAVVPDIIAYVAIHLRYDTTWYVLSGRSLRIRRGIWVIRETTITYENVQDVKIHQGPVQRYYGISDVLVATAGGGGHHEENGASNTHLGRIEGIDDAARIRDLVMSRVRASRTAGLGDERHEHAATGSPVGPAWTPQHVAVLREIRQAVADLRSASM